MPGFSRARNTYFYLLLFFFAFLASAFAQNRIPEKTTTALNSLSNAFENLAEICRTGGSANFFNRLCSR